MKKAFIKLLSVVLVLSMAFSVSAAEFEAGKHADSSVVNIKGTIDAEDIAGNQKVTVSVIEDLGLATERVAHIQEIEINEIGMFEAKFKCEANNNSQLKVCYNGEVINDSLIEADIDGVSKLMNVNIVLLSDRGGAFNQKDWGAMPVYTYNYADRGIVNATYQSKYTFKTTEGVQAYIKVENTYGLDESFSPIIACYGENNKLLGTRIFDKEIINFADPVKTVQTDIIDLPDGTIRAKAFAWNKDQLIPFGDSNEGELDKINVILVGASTAQDWPRDITKNATHYPLEGFGRFLKDYFNPEFVNYYNESVSGASTTSFLDDSEGGGYWPNVMRWVQPGSIVIIELGGNDRGKTVGEDGKFSPEKFKENLRIMYDDVIANGGKVIFAGVTADAGTVVDGKLQFSSTRHAVTECKREFAELTGSDFITCEQAITDFYNEEIDRLGSVDNVRGYYFRDTRYMTGDKDGEITYSFDQITEENMYVPGNFEEKTDKDGNGLGYAIDTTHTNLRGADVAAQKFYEAIVASDSILKAYTK